MLTQLKRNMKLICRRETARCLVLLRNVLMLHLNIKVAKLSRFKCNIFFIHCILVSYVFLQLF